jgi:hypothetical protein
MGKLSATICVPFGAETVENDPCTVGTTSNCTVGVDTLDTMYYLSGKEK